MEPPSPSVGVKAIHTVDLVDFSLSIESTSSIDLDYTAARPIAVSTTSYTCDMTAIDRTTSSPISYPQPPQQQQQQQQSCRPIQRSTYAIKEELESSPNCTAVASCSVYLTSPNTTMKTPPKSARSDVIQSIYTASAKKLLPSQNGGPPNVHPCCHSHSGGTTTTTLTSNGAEETASATNPQESYQRSSTTVIHQNGSSGLNGCGDRAEHADGMKREDTVNGFADEQPKKTATIEKVPNDRRPDQPPPPVPAAATNGVIKHSSVDQAAPAGARGLSAATNGRTENSRKSIAPNAEAMKAQKVSKFLKFFPRA